MIHTLANNVTGSGSQTSVFPHRNESTEGTMQVTQTSGTTVLEGRNNPNAGWTTVATFTTTGGGQIVALFAEMRVTLTSGVAVKAFLSEPGD